VSEDFCHYPRDITEKISLGLAKPSAAIDYDVRLFNQSRGMHSGLNESFKGAEDGDSRDGPVQFDKDQNTFPGIDALLGDVKAS
jgi:hypothetical protein